MVVTGADEKFFGIPHLSHARRKKFNGPGRLLFKPETFTFFSPLHTLVQTLKCGFSRNSFIKNAPL